MPKTAERPKNLLKAVRFARFSADWGIPPGDLADMIHYAEKSAKAYERNDSAAENAYADLISMIAAAYHVKVIWAGLWPTLEKGGHQDSLPEFS
jgi:hypothetical protein